jgi:hypothetical protein
LITPLVLGDCSPEFLLRFEKAVYKRNLREIKRAFANVFEFSGSKSENSIVNHKFLLVRLEFIFFYALFLKVRRAYLSTISNPKKKLENVLMRFIYMIA